MAGLGRSRAEENRRIRQEALREQLAAQGHEQHIIEISRKLRDLDEELDALSIQRLKAAADNHRAMLDKYLPNLKQTDSNIEIHATLADASDAELDSRIDQILTQKGQGGNPGDSGGES